MFLKKCPNKPNCLHSESRDPRHFTDPIKMSSSVPLEIKKIKKAFLKLPGTRLHSETKNHLHFVATTSLLRFKDDIEFYLDEVSNVIHIRSASRVGYSDWGLNKKRLEKFLLYYKSI